MPFSFSIEKKDPASRARAGVIRTPHGDIPTPAFIAVGTKAAVKALSPEQVAALGAEAVLANTYHLYLEPGEKLIKEAGGLGAFMQWPGPTFTDSGGFQVFSLGAAYGGGAARSGISKIVRTEKEPLRSEGRAESIGSSGKAPSADGDLCPRMQRSDSVHEKLAKIDDDGVSFRSVLDGSEHRFTPEKSLQIQHGIGADIIFAFDECTSPDASREYQREAMERTHAWAARSLAEHKKLGGEQALFGIVQGGRYEDLRKESARVIGAMSADGRGFDGFGIGGSFDKSDMYGVVGWVSGILPPDRPRHLLGIGEPADLFGGVENGADTFDCVAPTRLGRNGTLYSWRGKININNANYKSDLSPLGRITGAPDAALHDPAADGSPGAPCPCYACANYSAAYLAHLFRADEMFAATLASIHNLYFIVNLVKRIRQSILDGDLTAFKERFLAKYGSKV